MFNINKVLREGFTLRIYLELLLEYVTKIICFRAISRTQFIYSNYLESQSTILNLNFTLSKSIGVSLAKKDFPK